MLRLFFLLLLLITAEHLSAQKGCNHTISTNTNLLDGINVMPGDTICINGGQRDYLLLRNISGTAAQPVVVVNRPSTAVINTNHFYGIKIANCRHLKLIGTSSPSQPYGIRITRVGSGGGISVDELSTNIEIAHIEIANTALAGIYAKTDPDCSFTSTRDKFTMYNLIVRNCYLHDIADEGLYIGSSKFTGQYLPSCDTTVLPHLIHGVRVYHNLIERTGWDGIQVSSAPVDCQIYGNVVKYDSQRETPNQMSGILIGGGSKCDCYNNQIFDGKGDGIDAFGLGLQKIYNNLIVRAGKTFYPGDPSFPRHGIFIGNSPDGSSATFHLMHNTIIEPKSTGIRFSNNNTTNNLIFNNIIAKPGDFELLGQNAYFQNSSSSVSFNIRNNIFTQNQDSLRFKNPSSDDYDLMPNSTAINKGFYAGLNAVAFDLLNRPRPHNQGYDIGAFECQDINASNTENPEDNLQLNHYIHNNNLIIRAISPLSGEAYLTLTDLQGKTLYRIAEWINHNEPHLFTLEKLPKSSGIYMLHFQQLHLRKSLRIPVVF